MRKAISNVGNTAIISVGQIWKLATKCGGVDFLSYCSLRKQRALASWKTRLSSQILWDGTHRRDGALWKVSWFAADPSRRADTIHKRTAIKKHLTAWIFRGATKAKNQNLVRKTLIAVEVRSPGARESKWKDQARYQTTTLHIKTRSRWWEEGTRAQRRTNDFSSGANVQEVKPGKRKCSFILIAN